MGNILLLKTVTEGINYGNRALNFYKLLIQNDGKVCFETVGSLSNLADLNLQAHIGNFGK